MDTGLEQPKSMELEILERGNGKMEQMLYWSEYYFPWFSLLQ